MFTVQNYINGLNDSLKELLQQDIEAIADIIFTAYKKGAQIFIMGNGGSATTAVHFARDLKIGTAVRDKPRVQATSLTDNIALITALGNDIDYSSIFSEQLVGNLKAGDVIIALSASGNSPNVLKATEFARNKGAMAVALIGFGGGKLKGMADKSVVLSSSDYGLVEDIHLSLAHIICCLVGERIKNG